MTDRVKANRLILKALDAEDTARLSMLEAWERGDSEMGDEFRSCLETAAAHANALQTGLCTKFSFI